MKTRHKVIWGILRPVVALFIRCKFGYRYTVPRQLPKQYMVLSNHVTDWDPIFLGVAFPKQMYFVGSEHIARWPRAYALIKYAFDPIVRPKGASAMAAVMAILRRVKAGANICFFPEGVRSWDGRPSPIVPSTAKLVKKAGVGLVTFRLTGGYFVSPMWSNSMRKGHLSGAPVHIYTAEELAAMSEEEIYDIIVQDLGEDAYARQEQAPTPYRSRTLAEGLEHMVSVCPVCGARETMETAGALMRCTACGHRWELDACGYLSDGENRLSVMELADGQKEIIGRDVAEGRVYRAAGVCVSTVAEHKEKEICRGELMMDGESIRCGDWSVPLSAITDFAMHGKFALVFSAGREYYEIVPDERCNMIRFYWYFLAFSGIKVA